MPRPRREPDTPRPREQRLPRPGNCLICSDPCGPYDRNTDGTWAHDQCLRDNMLQPSGPDHDDEPGPTL